MTPAEPRQHGWTLRFQTLRVSETLRVWEGKARAQGLVEFALILPFLLLLTLGVIEAGRMLAIFSSVSSAARQAARYGSVGGDTGSGSPYFLDCAGIRSAAQSNSVMWRLSNDNVKISYERPVTATGTFSLIGACGPSSATPTYSGGGATRTMTEDDIENGYRILITVTTTYRPVVPIVPIPPIPLTFAAARTIFPAIEGPTATPKPFPDVALTLSDSPDPVTISNPVTYTIVVANNGASGDAATGAIVVTQTVPSGWSGYTASGSGWTCSSSSAAPTLVTCRHSSSLAAGTTSTITVRMTAPNTSGTASTTATMRVAQADSTTSNNADTETTLVIAGSDLIISKKDVADPVLPSAPPTYSIITYTLVVTNTQGEAVPSGATTTVTDVIPLASGVSFLSASGFGWSCTFVSGEVKCTRTGSLAVGAAFPPIFIQVYAPDFENIVINDTGGVSLSGGVEDSVEGELSAGGRGS